MSKKYSRYESTTFSRNKPKKNDKHPYNPNRRKGKPNAVKASPSK